MKFQTKCFASNPCVFNSVVLLCVPPGHLHEWCNDVIDNMNTVDLETFFVINIT